jgi:hypothetical protein
MRILIERSRRRLPLLYSHLSCSSRGPLTPEEAFGVIQKAYHRGNPELMLSVLFGGEPPAYHRDGPPSSLGWESGSAKKLAERLNVAGGTALAPFARGLSWPADAHARALNDDALGKGAGQRHT